MTILLTNSRFLRTECTFPLRYLLRIGIFLACLLFFCEVLIYYIVLLRCTWPLLNTGDRDPGIYPGNANESPLKVMMIADTHLLGPYRGHWFDRLRREWQMSRTFVTAMTLHAPDLVVFLGDLFDEGKWMDGDQFNNDVKRFHKLFPRLGKTEFIVAVGNHDVGFHYKMEKQLLQRFQRVFSQSDSGVDIFNIRGNVFIVLNSMALEGDNCSLCRDAERDFRNITSILRCSKLMSEERPVTKDCEERLTFMPHYTRPIILQHYPLYREDDRNCFEGNTDSVSEKYRAKWDVISEEMTSRILKMVSPRAVFNGHSHRSCLRFHNLRESGHKATEWTLPSYNWRNNNNPSFILAAITPNNLAVSRCSMPQESSVFVFYVVGLLSYSVWCTFKSYRGIPKLALWKN